MIEFWQPGNRKPIEVSPDELREGLELTLGEEPHTLEDERVIKGVISFLEELHALPRIGGVALSLIDQPPAPTTLYVSVLTALRRGSEECTLAVRNAAQAKVRLATELYQIMPSGMSFYNSEYLSPRAFVTKIRRHAGRSKVERSAGVFLFKR